MKRRTFLKKSIAAGVTSAAVGGSLLTANMAFADDDKAAKKDKATETEAKAEGDAATDDKKPEASSSGAGGDIKEAKSVDEVLEKLGISKPEESDKVTVDAPEVAENGAQVQMTLSSKIEGTTEIIVLIAENPTIYTAKFVLGEGINPAIKSRFKMGKTSDVIAVVKAGDKYYTGKKAVKVTEGGCGG